MSKINKSVTLQAPIDVGFLDSMQESSINYIQESSSALIKQGERLKTTKTVFIDAATEMRKKKDISKSPLGFDHNRGNIKSNTQTR